MAKSVNIFVLNWNGRELTLDCLASLEKVTYSNANVIVIDNGSTDDSVFSIKEQYPETDIIEFPTNLGFAGGNNAGFQSTANKADYTIFLNNDTIVDSNFVAPLINELETKSNTKQTAPKIYYADKPETIWFAGGIVNLWTGMIRHIGIRKKDSSLYSKKWKLTMPRGVVFACVLKILNPSGCLTDPSLCMQRMWIYHFGLKKEVGASFLFLNQKYGIKYRLPWEGSFPLLNGKENRKLNLNYWQNM